MKFLTFVAGVGLSSHHASAFVPSAFSAGNAAYAGVSGRLPSSNVKNPSIVDIEDDLLHQSEALLHEAEALLAEKDIKELKEEGKMSTVC